MNVKISPIPITGHTIGVMLSGAVLGAHLGAASQLLYWLCGMIGLPFFTERSSGWKVATGEYMGYFIGFIFSAYIVGYRAEHGFMNTFLNSIISMSFASAAIYVCGAPWFAFSKGNPILFGDKNGIQQGVVPFLVGDFLKLVLVAIITTSAWSILG